jgi:hypothetical protein
MEIEGVIVLLFHRLCHYTSDGATQEYRLSFITLISQLSEIEQKEQLEMVMHDDLGYNNKPCFVFIDNVAGFQSLSEKCFPNLLKNVEHTPKTHHHHSKMVSLKNSTLLQHQHRS